MAWYDSALQTLGVIAPTIATALGGPLAGMATNALLQALGVGSTEEAQAVIANMDPATAAKIRQADQQFKLDMEKLGVDVLKLEASDRDSARRRESEVKDKTPMVLAAVIVLGFMGALSFLSWHEVPSSNKEVTFILLGALTAGLSSVLQYYFGSTTGSKAKDSVTASMTKVLADKSTGWRE